MSDTGTTANTNVTSTVPDANASTTPPASDTSAGGSSGQSGTTAASSASTTPDTSSGTTASSTPSAGGDAATTTPSTGSGTTDTGGATSTPSTASSTPLTSLGTGTTTAPLSAADASSSATSTPSGTASTTVGNTNTAVAGTTGTTTAVTGGNTANDNPNGTVIQTGQGIALANVLNVINTNITNSAGFLMFLESIGNFGTLNLESLFATSSLPSLSSPCPVLCSSQASSLTSVANTNAATILNDIVVRSDTGGNSASGNGTSTIATGDAYAAANVVNVANTNIIDSNYLLLVFNGFGSGSGNFVLPNADFFNELFYGRTASTTGKGGGSSAISVTNTNNAAVTNDVSATAATGGNSASGNASSTIATGNATSGTSVSNFVNTNLFGGTNLRILLRVQGNWAGNVFGLPPGVHWTQTPEGIELFGGGSAAAGGEGTPGTGTGSTTVAIQNTNTASIDNNVNVYALTGQNEIGGSGNASIQTGNAYAGANVVNMANTNVIGANWFTLIINMFGNWNGNIEFGQPDLWLGTSATSVEGNYGPGTHVKYDFTIANHGDADATNVMLTNTFTSPFISFNGLNAPNPYLSSWNVGTVPAHGSIDVSYVATINPEIPNGSIELPSTATVAADESDANPADNTDTISVATNRPYIIQNGPTVPMTPDPALVVTKTNDAIGPLVASSTVTYHVVIKNNGGPAYDSILVDDLKDAAGNIVSEHAWNLDTIDQDGEIHVDYTVLFSSAAANGVYTNVAQVHAIGRNPTLDPFYGDFADSNYASSTVTIFTPSTAPAAGSTTEAATSTPPSVTVSSIEKSTIPPPPKVSVRHTGRPLARAKHEVFPPLRPFSIDGRSGSVIIASEQETAAIGAAVPPINIPREFDLFMVILTGALLARNRVSVRKLRNAFTTFMW